MSQCFSLVCRMLTSSSYVHRLLQNSTDGQLVELPSATTVVSSRLSSLALDPPSTRSQVPAAVPANAKSLTDQSEHVARLSASLAEQKDAYEAEIDRLRGELAVASEKAAEGERRRAQLEEEQDRRRELEERVAELSTTQKRADTKAQIVCCPLVLPPDSADRTLGINPHSKTSKRPCLRKSPHYWAARKSTQARDFPRGYDRA